MAGNYAKRCALMHWSFFLLNDDTTCHIWGVNDRNTARTEFWSQCHILLLYKGNGLKGLAQRPRAQGAGPRAKGLKRLAQGPRAQGASPRAKGLKGLAQGPKGSSQILRNPPPGLRHGRIPEVRGTKGSLPAGLSQPVDPGGVGGYKNSTPAGWNPYVFILRAEIEINIIDCNWSMNFKSHGVLKKWHLPIPIEEYVCFRDWNLDFNPDGQLKFDVQK